METSRFNYNKYEKNNFRKNKKIIFIFAAAAIIIIFLLIIISSENNYLSNFSEAKKTVSVDDIKLSLSPAKKVDDDKYIMTIGEESTVFAEIILDSPGYITAYAEIPDGFEYLSGKREIRTAVENDTAELKPYLRAVRVGSWNLTVHAMNEEGEGKKRTIRVCIDVMESGARKRCE